MSDPQRTVIERPPASRAKRPGGMRGAAHPHLTPTTGTAVVADLGVLQHLQRTVGNTAVNHLLRQYAAQPTLPRARTAESAGRQGAGSTADQDTGPRVTTAMREVQREPDAGAVAVPAQPDAGAPAAAPPAAPPPRVNLVFILGQDADSRKPFYAEATRYYRAMSGATVVTDKRDLVSVLDYVAGLGAVKVGGLYLVSHAHEDGSLGFKLREMDTDPRIDFKDLRDNVKTLPAASDKIDAATTIYIKGCNIGRSKAMMELVEQAFGGRSTLIAPTHRQEYSHRRGGKSHEELNTYFIEQPGKVTLDRKAIAAAFRAKYTHVTAAMWKKLLPQVKRTFTNPVEWTYTATAPDNQHAVATYAARAKDAGWKLLKLLSHEQNDAGAVVTHSYKFKCSNLEDPTVVSDLTVTENVPTDASQIEVAKNDSGRPDAYRWTASRTTPNAHGQFKIQVRAERTEWDIPVDIAETRDRQDQTDSTFYTTVGPPTPAPSGPTPAPPGAPPGP